MDVEALDGFWRRLAQTRLRAEQALSPEEILAGLLGQWPTCVLCNLLWEWAFDRLSRWQEALTENPERQAAFIGRERWCNRHAWFFRDLASPRTRSRVHRGLFALAEGRIRELLQADLGPLIRQEISHLQQDLLGAGRCPLCDVEAAFLTGALAELARGLSLGSLRGPFAASGGCCLPHLAALLHALPDAETARFVLETTAAQLRRLREELETYEVETERRTRRYGSSADAPARAMVRWVGMRGIVASQDGPKGAAPVSAGRDGLEATGDVDAAEAHRGRALKS